MRHSLVLLLGGLLAASTPANAHPVTYVGGTDRLLVCQDQPLIGLGMTPGLGGACFAPGHVTTTVTLADSFLAPMSGAVCQPLVWPKPFYLAPFDCAPGTFQLFCGSVVGTAASGFHDFLGVVVFVSSPLSGNPATSPCGGIFSFGTVGSVGHD